MVLFVRIRLIMQSNTNETPDLPKYLTIIPNDQEFWLRMSDSSICQGTGFL